MKIQMTMNRYLALLQTQPNHSFPGRVSFVAYIIVVIILWIQAVSIETFRGHNKNSTSVHLAGIGTIFPIIFTKTSFLSGFSILMNVWNETFYNQWIIKKLYRLELEGSPCPGSAPTPCDYITVSALSVCLSSHQRGPAQTTA